MNCRTLHAARLCPLLLAIAAPTIAAEPHWDDAWQPVTGQWQAKGGEYVQSDPSLYGAWSLWTAERFANAEIRVRFQIEPVGSGVRAAGIVFRAVDNDHFFFAHFDSRNDQLLVTRWSAGASKHLARIPAIGLETSRWHGGRVRCMGTKARVYLDDRLLSKDAGATWLQLGNKSMLMNQKLGQRLADGCRNEQQMAREEELKLNPVDLLK